MIIDTKSIVSITEANQNFSKVARLVDELGVSSNYEEQCAQIFGNRVCQG